MCVKFCRVVAGSYLGILSREPKVVHASTHSCKIFSVYITEVFLDTAFTSFGPQTTQLSFELHIRVGFDSTLK